MILLSFPSVTFTSSCSLFLFFSNGFMPSLIPLTLEKVCPHSPLSLSLLPATLHWKQVTTIPTNIAMINTSNSPFALKCDKTQTQIHSLLSRVERYFCAATHTHTSAGATRLYSVLSVLTLKREKQSFEMMTGVHYLAAGIPDMWLIRIYPPQQSSSFSLLCLKTLSMVSKHHIVNALLIWLRALLSRNCGHSSVIFTA